MTIALDIGLKRIGVALGFSNGVCVPLPAVIRKNRNQAAAQIKAILAEHAAKRLVVGIPLGGSSEDEMKRRISHFVNLLEFDGEICYVDESFSSAEAAEFGANLGRKKDGKLDSLSALVILQRFFEKSLFT